MKPIALIGTSIIDQHITLDSLEPNRCNKVGMRLSHGGSMRNICEHLCDLHQTSVFVSIFGNDAFAQEMVDHLRSKLAIVFDKRVALPSPMFTTLSTTPPIKMCSISQDFVFQEHDFLPMRQLEMCDLVLTDLQNPHLLEKLSAKHQVFVNGYVPSPAQLPYLQGAIFSMRDTTFSLEELQHQLSPLPLVVITHHDLPIHVLEYGVLSTHPLEQVLPQNRIGSGDAFSAAFLKLYTQEQDVERAIRFAAKYAYDFIKQDDEVA
ncbi:MAG: hypothetical protein ACRDBX_05975 [Erysipelotrichaceae bacterium]